MLKSWTCWRSKLSGLEKELLHHLNLLVACKASLEEPMCNRAVQLL